MFNMGVQIALPNPSSQTTQFSVDMPVGGNYHVAVIGNSVFLDVLIQSPNTIPANPPTTPILFTYRALNSSWRDDTATVFNNFVGFVDTASITVVLTQQTPIGG